MNELRDKIVSWNKGIERGAQLRFSKAVGVNQATVSRWMKGISPSEDQLPKIAKVLGVEPDDLLRGVPKNLKEAGPSYNARGVDPGIFPEPLRQRIRNEAEKRYLDFQTAVVVLLGEHFSEKPDILKPGEARRRS